MSEDRVWMTKEEFRDSVYKTSYHLPPLPTPIIGSGITALYLDSPEYDRLKRLCYSKGLGILELIEVLESLPNKE